MSYPGSKGQAGVWQTIIGQMPPHELYVEAFFGSGQIFWRKLAAAESIIIDRRADLLVKAGQLPGATAMVGDAISLLPELLLDPNAVVYLDPPYLLETRQGRLYYEFEFSEADHCRLLDLIKALSCRCLISHTPCELYSTALASWRCLSYRTRWHNKTVTECLWCNFPEPERLHDWRFAGLNYRQRLTLKRLAGRWLKRLSAMPARKRGYVLEQIRQAEAARIP